MTNKLSNKLIFTSIFNSVSYFLLSFIVIYFINILTTNVISNVFGIESVIRNFRVEFLLSPHSEKWNIDNIVIIFVSAPLVSLFAGGLISRLLNLFGKEDYYAKLFLIWAYYHSMTFSFGAFIASVLSKDGIWYAVAWMRVPFYFQLLLAVVFIFILYFAGSLVRIYFYESSFYPSPNSIKSKQIWFVNSALISWLAGSIIVLLFLIPNVRIYEVLILASTLVLLIPAIVKVKLIPDIVSNKSEPIPILWKIFVFTLLLFFTLRFI